MTGLRALPIHSAVDRTVRSPRRSHPHLRPVLRFRTVGEIYSIAVEYTLGAEMVVEPISRFTSSNSCPPPRRIPLRPRCDRHVIRAGLPPGPPRRTQASLPQRGDAGSTPPPTPPRRGEGDERARCGSLSLEGEGWGEGESPAVR